MDRLQLYKEFYFFEIKRKGELDSAVTTPVITISTIITIYTYFLTNLKEGNMKYAVIGLSVVAGGAITFSLIYLTKSFFNWGKANLYREINSMKEYFDYDQNLLKANQKANFEPFLEERFATCAGHNFVVNKRRTEELSTAKKGIYGAIIITGLSSLIYIYSII